MARALFDGGYPSHMPPASVRKLALWVEWIAWAYLNIAVVGGVITMFIRTTRCYGVECTTGRHTVWLGFGIVVTGIFQASAVLMASAYIQRRTEPA